jgi:hypothetical protein
MRGKALVQENVEDWKKCWLLQEIEGYDLCDINNADATGLFFSLQHSKTLLFKDNFPMVVQNLNIGLLGSLHALKVVVINYHSNNWKI